MCFWRIPIQNTFFKVKRDHLGDCSIGASVSSPRLETIPRWFKWQCFCCLSYGWQSRLACCASRQGRVWCMCWPYCWVGYRHSWRPCWCYRVLPQERDYRYICQKSTYTEYICLKNAYLGQDYLSLMPSFCSTGMYMQVSIPGINPGTVSASLISPLEKQMSTRCLSFWYFGTGHGEYWNGSSKDMSTLLSFYHSSRFFFLLLPIYWELLFFYSSM